MQQEEILSTLDFTQGHYVRIVMECALCSTTLYTTPYGPFYAMTRLPAALHTERCRACGVSRPMVQVYVEPKENDGVV